MANNLALANNLIVQQFNHQVLHIGIAAGERLALLGLEDDVLNSLHVGWRTGLTYLLEVGVDVGCTPLSDVQIRLSGIGSGNSFGLLSRTLGRNGAFLYFMTRLALRGRQGAAEPLTVTTKGNGASTVSTPPSM